MNLLKYSIKYYFIYKAADTMVYSYYNNSVSSYIVNSVTYNYNN